jgi:SSS family solute:Na+ symporter
MFGMQLVLAQMGLDVHLSLIVAFVVLAAFTYVSGLRAPALIALVKDTLIWAAVIIAIVYIPIKLGGFGAIFSHVPAAKLTLKPALLPYFSTLALGSAFALFLYPHAITGIFSSRSQAVLRRNSAFLPAYSFMLGLIALFGYMAIAAGVHAAKPPIGANVAVPALIARMFSEPVAGFFFAAIAIGALVPASVMSIAAANLFSRNVWKEFLHPAAGLKEQADVSKVVSLLVKFGALLFILIANTQYAIYFQLAGGVWMMQVLPAVFMALYFKWLDRWAIVAGWLIGEGFGTYLLLQNQFKVVSYVFNIGGNKTTLYIGLVAFFFNLLVVIVGSALARAMGVRTGKPILTDEDYLARRSLVTREA